MHPIAVQKKSALNKKNTKKTFEFRTMRTELNFYRFKIITTSTLAAVNKT
jgi:hypothetical protein